jgi:hypothetical protein
MSINEAFFTVCDNAEPASECYVSLYLNTPYYGGPEEGGWWGSDCSLVAFRKFDTEQAADAALERVKELAKELNEQAKREFGEHCLRQMEWLDARGLDSDFLPEVDGESSYWVCIEEMPGQYASRGCRHYE